MNILALIESQRRNGNTARIVQMIEARMHALASAIGVPLEFETLFLSDHDIRPCRGCRACFDHGEERCPLDDDVALMAFRIQQLVWRREPAGSYDRAYWQAHGWLTPGCTFSVPHRASPIRVVVARLTGAIVHRFVV